MQISLILKPLLRLTCLLTNDVISSNFYDKRKAFNFETVNFPFLDRDIPFTPFYAFSTSFRVYNTQLITKASTLMLERGTGINLKNKVLRGIGA